jgi:hypothetical protein
VLAATSLLCDDSIVAVVMAVTRCPHEWMSAGGQAHSEGSGSSRFESLSGYRLLIEALCSFPQLLQENAEIGH